MQFKTVPGLGVAFGVFLHPPIADIREFGHCLIRCLLHLPVQAFQFRRLPLLSLGRPTFLTWHLDCFCLLRSLLPPNDRCRVPTHMTDQLSAQVLLDHGIMDGSAQISPGKSCKGPGKGRFRRNVLTLGKTADAPEVRSCLQLMEQYPGVRVTKKSLRNITSGYGSTLSGRSAHPLPVARNMLFYFNNFK